MQKPPMLTLKQRRERWRVAYMDGFCTTFQQSHEYGFREAVEACAGWWKKHCEGIPEKKRPAHICTRFCWAEMKDDLLREE